MSDRDPARPVRVLHLEDNRRDAAMVRSRLDAAALCCDILVVDSKDRFEAALTREPFDLILSDYTLPGYDGITALQFVQQTQPEVPVILISGTIGEEAAVQCLRIGAIDYVLKERLERLAPAVQRALQEAESRRTRRRAEAALRESEARKAAILDSVLDCIVTMDADGIVLEFNAAAVKTFGYTKAEAIGRPLVDLIVPQHLRERHSAGLARYRATGEAVILGRLTEMVAVRADGSEIPVELTITAIRTGAALVFTGVLRDITARREAEATLRAERDRAEQYLDTAEVILLKLDKNARVLLVNRYACAVLGWTADELLGRDWFTACVPAGARDAIRAGFLHPFGEETSVSESPVITRSGEVRWFEWRCRLLRDDDGQPVGSFSSGTDITERNLAVQALTKAEERVRFVLEAVGAGIWDLDFTTGVLQWSTILESQHGLQPGTFGGTLDDFLARVHPGDRETVIQTLATHRAGGNFSLQHRTFAADGTVRWLGGAGRIDLGPDGTPVRGVGIFLDVTDRHTLEDQYQQAQKMEAIGQLAAGVAHDFNNLLTVILGFCELLMSDFDPGDPRYADITEIHKAGARAAGLTRQLLAFSRKEIIEPALLDLNTIAADIQVLLGRLIGDDVKVLLGLARAHTPVMADRGQLEQIILNLAVNARDAMPNGGTLTIETATVDIGAAQTAARLPLSAGPYVTLTVTDTGTGMTPEVQARLFEPFFTTKGVGKGTGLGLATVQGIVARSGGLVTVDSVPGRGTAFTVYFPRADAATLRPAADPIVAEAPPTGQTVLVVEDADGLRELTRRLLQRQGYTVLLAANAAEALQIFEQNAAIDVLLTDVVMPGASGPELVSQLEARWPALKVIYMSGYTDDAIVHRGVLDPGIAFLHKPFNGDTLGRKLREVLGR